MSNPPHKSAPWYGFLTVNLFVGAILVWAHPSALGFLARASARIKPDACGRFVGIVLISVVPSHFLIYWALSCIHRLFGIDASKDKNRWPPVILGTLEGILYLIALVTAKADFIGFWVVVKTAGGWVRWSGSPTQDQDALDEARRRFYGFLVGNALTIIAALVIFGTLKLFVLMP